MAQFYRIYAGLGGGFGGAEYHGTYEFSSQEEAERYAYDLAWDEYESYGGYHGLDDRDAVYENCLASEVIEPGAQSEAEIDIIVDEYYIEQVESWIEWRVEPVQSSIDFADTTDADWHDISDNADDYCDD